MFGRYESKSGELLQNCVYIPKQFSVRLSMKTGSCYFDPASRFSTKADTNWNQTVSVMFFYIQTRKHICEEPILQSENAPLNRHSLYLIVLVQLRLCPHSIYHNQRCSDIKSLPQPEPKVASTIERPFKLSACCTFIIIITCNKNCHIFTDGTVPISAISALYAL